MCRRFHPFAVAVAVFASAASAQTSPPIGLASLLDGAAGSADWVGVPFPNPFTDSALLTYTLDRPGLVRVELFDALGRRVSVIEDEVRPAGAYRVRFNGGALVPGLYVVRVTTGDWAATRRLVRGR